MSSLSNLSGTNTPLSASTYSNLPRQNPHSSFYDTCNYSSNFQTSSKLFYPYQNESLQHKKSLRISLASDSNRFCG